MSATVTAPSPSRHIDAVLNSIDALLAEIDRPDDQDQEGSHVREAVRS